MHVVVAPHLNWYFGIFHSSQTIKRKYIFRFDRIFEALSGYIVLLRLCNGFADIFIVGFGNVNGFLFWLGFLGALLVAVVAVCLVGVCFFFMSF